MRKKRRTQKSEQCEVVRLWTHAQAKGALPYLRSVSASLREHWLTAQGKTRLIERLKGKPGRVDKSTLLALQETQNEQARAENHFQEAMEEILAMHVFPIDVNQGLALIPFRQKDELAWFVFDLFDPKGMPSWRFHNDPLEKRRPIAEVQENQKEEMAI